MWNNLQQFFRRRPDKVVGIDIGASSVRAAELTWRDGQPLLAHFGMADLPPGTIDNGHCRDIAALTEALRQVLNTSGAKERDAVLAVGSPGLFIREVAYPVMTPAELAEAVKWDSEKHISFEPGSYYFDFAVLGQANELEMKVLLTASPRDVVDGLVTAAKGAGLRTVCVDAEPLALYRTLSVAHNSMVVDIGAEMSQVTLFQGGSPVFTRPIPIGGKRFTEVVMDVFELDFAEAERFKQRQQGLLPRDEKGGEQTPIQRQLEALATELAQEALRTAQYYNMQNKTMVIDKLFLAGGGAKLDNLSSYFAAQLDVPVIVHDPLATLAVNPRLDSDYVRNVSLRFGVAVGLALGGGRS
ncbi:MAG: type IV pilus assembly protein PilM [Negativicutes bacterium]|nr:type IV pilus assembly protein PilM [Negativicutes bacterium]